VGVKEKNSLRSIIKGEHTAMDNGFKTYYFPEIPIEHPFDEDDGSGDETCFRRSLGNGKLFDEIQEDQGKFGGRRGRVALIEDKGYSEGFAKGEREGLAAARKKLEPVLENFVSSLGKLDKINKEIRLHSEKETIELALAIAEKIVGYEISTNKDLILGVVKKALKKVMDHEKIIIRISPSDLATLNDSGFEPANLSDNIDDIVIVEDEKISNGGCIVETDFGDIDARLEKQFQAVKETFESLLK